MKKNEEMFQLDDLDEFPVETFAEFTKNHKKKRRKHLRFSLPDKNIMIIFLAVLLVICAFSGIVGYQLGYRSAFSDGYADGYEEGNDLGYNEGFDIGKKDGYDVGYEDGGNAAKNDMYYGIYNNGITENPVAAGSSDMVYCTASGTVYHWEGCSYIAGKSNLKTMSEADAIAGGYHSCSRCGK